MVCKGYVHKDLPKFSRQMERHIQIAVSGIEEKERQGEVVVHSFGVDPTKADMKVTHLILPG